MFQSIKKPINFKVHLFNCSSVFRFDSTLTIWIMFISALFFGWLKIQMSTENFLVQFQRFKSVLFESHKLSDWQNSIDIELLPIEILHSNWDLKYFRNPFSLLSCPCGSNSLKSWKLFGRCEVFGTNETEDYEHGETKTTRRWKIDSFDVYRPIKCVLFAKHFNLPANAKMENYFHFSFSSVDSDRNDNRKQELSLS